MIWEKKFKKRPETPPKTFSPVCRTKLPPIFLSKWKVTRKVKRRVRKRPKTPPKTFSPVQLPKSFSLALLQSSAPAISNAKSQTQFQTSFHSENVQAWQRIKKPWPSNPFFERKKCRGNPEKKTRVFLFMEPLKSLEKEGRTHPKEARKIGKKARKSRKKQGKKEGGSGKKVQKFCGKLAEVLRKFGEIFLQCGPQIARFLRLRLRIPSQARNRCDFRHTLSLKTLSSLINYVRIFFITIFGSLT